MSGPPSRYDHVGSFLRPQEVLDARKKFFGGEISAEQLREVENKHVEELAKKMQEVGIKSITDGEYRRQFFHTDFLKQLEGVEEVGGIVPSAANQFAQQPNKIAVTGKLRHTKGIELNNYLFLSPLVTAKGAVVKITIPSPTMLHFRGGRESINIEAYPDLDVFFDDLAKLYRAEIDTLYKAGCRYIQFDDTNLAYLCDLEMRKAAAERLGGDINALPRQYAQLINSCIDGRPNDLTIGIHLCRGNFRSQHFAQGGYEPIAEVLFGELNVDIYLLEWENERSGDFKPLRFLPKGKKTVVLGLISSKFPELESKEEIITKIHEAAKYAPLEQLALSPQCGFSSTAHGNQITPDTQWEKMKLVIEIAKSVWPDA
ncbi:hypothetical protein DL96DRAFT_1587506 [Flagelloscypha sp. PMI_526]|nr:hypothetical protein DL96DRAFT_1587506 [Flagelloscypha sp. PMI_526]